MNFAPVFAPPFSGLLQAAGVHDLQEARAVAEAGFHLLGIPLRLPVHTPDLDEAQAAELTAALPSTLAPVLITYETEATALLELRESLRVRHLQLHASQGALQDAALLCEIKKRAPELFIIKSLVVGACHQDELEAQLQACAPYADAFITDTFDPVSGASGATGVTHDWTVSRRLARLSPRPLILAGGLDAGNVAAAIRFVRPAGVDAHSGLEDAAGRKSPQLMRAFVHAAREAFAEVQSACDA